jgi:hypothetical protein
LARGKFLYYLKYLSNTHTIIYCQEVGNKSFPGLIKVLHTDFKDVDITKSLLETITILCTVQHQVSGYQNYKKKEEEKC